MLPQSFYILQPKYNDFNNVRQQNHDETAAQQQIHSFYEVFHRAAILISSVSNWEFTG